MSTWYVVQTKPRQEKRAAEHLNQQGGRVFLPQVPSLKCNKNGLTSQFSLLFPGYLFLCSNSGSALLGKVRSTLGVKGLLRFGDKPVSVAESIIKDLMDRCDAEEVKPLFKLGENVLMTSGPFKDYLALFTEMDGEKRAVVFIQLLNQQQRLVVDIADLAAV